MRHHNTRGEKKIIEENRGTNISKQKKRNKRREESRREDKRGKDKRREERRRGR